MDKDIQNKISMLHDERQYILNILNHVRNTILKLNPRLASNQLAKKIIKIINKNNITISKDIKHTIIKIDTLDNNVVDNRNYLNVLNANFVSYMVYTYNYFENKYINVLSVLKSKMQADR